MPGKQAKVLSDHDIRLLLNASRKHRYAARDRVIILLSVKAGLRAGEIAALTWSMVIDGRGRVGDSISLEDRAAKKGSGRRIPTHPRLRTALVLLLAQHARCGLPAGGPVIRSGRGGSMRARSIVNWFAQQYRAADLIGCSSHSGRRTFVTRAARAVHKAGGSLRDVQLLAGHRSIEMTQRYIDGDSAAQRRLVRLL